MTNLWQDFRYALRGLRKSPGFAAVAIITLALGIGANTAIFTVVNAVFFHPLPVKDPASLVQIYTVDQRQSGFGISYFPLGYPNAQDIQQRVRSFSGVALFFPSGVSMTVNGVPDQYFANLVSGNFFDVLGVPAAMGRTFLPQEDAQPGAGPVVVLSHGLWERKFASDHEVIGRNVLLNGQGFTIIGVAPRGFQGLNVLGGPDMWIPMSMHDQILSGLSKSFFNERRFLGMNAAARMKPGASGEQAKAELTTIANDLQRDFPLANKGRTFAMLPLLDSIVDPNQRSAFQSAGALMMIVVGIVLLVACFNIANLLLARASGRKREMSIRVAVGASRNRIIAQLLTESMVLAAAGGLLGLGLALFGRNLMWRFRPPQLPDGALDLSLDVHVLLFTILVAIGTGIIFGLAPALQSARPDLVSELKERSGGELYSGRRFRLRDVLVAVQVGICLVALIGAGLFLISLRNAQHTDAGFDTSNLAMLSFDLGSLNYEPARAKEFERRALEIVQNTPGIRAATMATVVPLFTGGFGRTLFREGEDASNGQNGKVAQIGVVEHGYLKTMGIPIIRGQDFDSSVREESTKVAIINETGARAVWPNEDPIGKKFRFFRETEWVQIIGVAKDSKYNSIGEDPRPYIYVPLIQTPSPAMTIFFRSSGDPRTVLNTVRSEVQAMDRNLPLTNVWPIGEVISQALWAAEFAASLLAVFAAVALILCAVGIYGVVAYSVGQRIREFGIRLALGARPLDVMLMVIRQNSVTMIVGLVLGLVAAFAGARFVIKLMYGVKGIEPLAYVGMAVGLAAIGLLASYIPARRAAKVDPMVALH